MEDKINWFKIPIIYPLTASFLTEEEISEVDRIKLNNEGLLNDFETDTGYFNLLQDPIVMLMPKCFIPKDKVNKKFYTELIFASGMVAYALGKPSSVYEALTKYIDEFVEEDKGSGDEDE
jgi:hypothetical protein